jgi:hypothetical protein
VLSMLDALYVTKGGGSALVRLDRESQCQRRSKTARLSPALGAQYWTVVDKPGRLANNLKAILEMATGGLWK